MPTVKISVAFDAEKLAAMRQFTEPGAPSIDELLRERLEKHYAKTVPAAVREYIDGRAATEPPAPPSRRRPASEG
ncbi:MAG: DUF6103 family protein [Oscillospiraceae bacterium]|jgi:hypothetical protein|nr:DUF6103 family protein [Oscillospiraceae bacterium]